ncbi:hypothetical protein G168_gp29 [Lactobacillus phage ATCC8014]|uniref:Uncharacterized protein n=1 Tax=Lactobacillus phage ATCC8014 TaxID=2892340 RepID=K4HZK0_9CAUD|nr:hypothetical protein G168_gp29 [Lactobacillus phage ATCC8014]AFU63036.1 hypothetical protein 8014-B1_0029 [Lactobacillus phage ATCC8014]
MNETARTIRKEMLAREIDSGLSLDRFDLNRPNVNTYIIHNQDRGDYVLTVELFTKDNEMVAHKRYRYDTEADAADVESELYRAVTHEDGGKKSVEQYKANLLSTLADKATAVAKLGPVGEHIAEVYVAAADYVKREDY